MILLLHPKPRLGILGPNFFSHGNDELKFASDILIGHGIALGMTRESTLRTEAQSTERLFGRFLTVRTRCQM